MPSLCNNLDWPKNDWAVYAPYPLFNNGIDPWYLSVSPTDTPCAKIVGILFCLTKKNPLISCSAQNSYNVTVDDLKSDLPILVKSNEMYNGSGIKVPPKFDLTIDNLGNLITPREFNL